MHICARLRLAGRPPNPALETWPARRTHTTHNTKHTHTHTHTHTTYTQMRNTAQHRTHTQHSTTHHSTERNTRRQTTHRTHNTDHTQNAYKTSTHRTHNEHAPHTQRTHTTKSHKRTHTYTPPGCSAPGEEGCHTKSAQPNSKNQPAAARCVVNTRKTASQSAIV